MTDHAHEAREWLAATVLPHHDDPAVFIARAQAEATLALVEQQRIANLIAAFQAGAPGDYLFEVSQGSMLTSRLVLKPEIREALGL